MQTIKLIGFLFLSIITQIFLIPFRLIVLVLNILGKFLRILEGTVRHMIELTLLEVLKRDIKNGRKKE